MKLKCEETDDTYFMVFTELNPMERDMVEFQVYRKYKIHPLTETDTTLRFFFRKSDSPFTFEGFISFANDIANKSMSDARFFVDFEIWRGSNVFYKFLI